MPNKYYEFNKHDYYALINAEDVDTALNLYYYYVAVKDLVDIRLEGLPDEVSLEYAKSKFIDYTLEHGHEDSLENAEKYFNKVNNAVLLIDSSIK